VICEEFPDDPKHNDVIYDPRTNVHYIYLKDKWTEYVPPTHYILGEDKADGTWMFHGIFSSSDPKTVCADENFFFAPVVVDMLLDGCDVRDLACYPLRNKETA